MCVVVVVLVLFTDAIFDSSIRTLLLGEPFSITLSKIFHHKHSCGIRRCVSKTNQLIMNMYVLCMFGAWFLVVIILLGTVAGEEGDRTRGLHAQVAEGHEGAGS